jgi:hypothetical protein
MDDTANDSTKLLHGISMKNHYFLASWIKKRTISSETHINTIKKHVGAFSIEDQSIE